MRVPCNPLALMDPRPPCKPSFLFCHMQLYLIMEFMAGGELFKVGNISFVFAPPVNHVCLQRPLPLLLRRQCAVVLCMCST